MKKQMFKLATVSAFMMAGLSAAHAGTNPGPVDVSGYITEYTCDLSIPPTSVSVNLGNHAPAEFTGTTAKVGTDNSLRLDVKNCAGSIPANGADLAVQLAVAQPSAAKNTLWGDAASTATGVGLGLELSGGVTDNVAITPANRVYPVLEATPAAQPLAGLTWSLPASIFMQSGAGPVANGKVHDVWSFTMAY